jgi:hypothetical protein
MRAWLLRWLFRVAPDDAKVVRLCAGDILAIRYPNRLRTSEIEHIAHQLQDIAPSGVRVVVLDGGASFQQVTWKEDSVA